MMEWFKHDVECMADEKLSALVLEYGAEGYAVFFRTLETMYHNNAEPLSNLAIKKIAASLKMTAPRVLEIIKYAASEECGMLFISTPEGFISDRVIEGCEKQTELIEKMRQLGKASAERRLNTMSTARSTIRSTERSTDKIRKEKNNNIVLSFTDVTDNTHSTPAGAEPPKTSKKPIDVNKIAELFNDICSSYPKATKLSDKRKQAIRARINSGYTLEDFKVLFLKAESSDFLKGANDRNWSATFDWLIADGNMAKVLDGNYDNNTKKYSKGTGKAFRPTDLNGQYDNLPPVEVIHV